MHPCRAWIFPKFGVTVPRIIRFPRRNAVGWDKRSAAPPAKPTTETRRTQRQPTPYAACIRMNMLALGGAAFKRSFWATRRVALQAMREEWIRCRCGLVVLNTAGEARSGTPRAAFSWPLVGEPTIDNCTHAGNNRQPKRRYRCPFVEFPKTELLFVQLSLSL